MPAWIWRDVRLFFPSPILAGVPRSIPTWGSEPHGLSFEQGFSVYLLVADRGVVSTQRDDWRSCAASRRIHVEPV